MQRYRSTPATRLQRAMNSTWMFVLPTSCISHLRMTSVPLVSPVADHSKRDRTVRPRAQAIKRITARLATTPPRARSTLVTPALARGKLAAPRAIRPPAPLVTLVKRVQQGAQDTLAEIRLLATVRRKDRRDARVGVG